MPATGFIEGLFLFSLSNLFALGMSWRCAGRVSPADDACWRLLTSTVLYLLLTSLLSLTLGLAGLLNAWAATAVLAGPGLYCLCRTRRAAHARVSPVLDGLSEIARSPWGRVLLPVTGGLAVGWLLRHLVAGTYLSFDDRTYHAANVAQWVADGKITLTAFSYQAYFPLNAELFSLWFFLPFKSDALVSVTGLVYAFLFFTASWALLRVMRVPPAFRLVPVLLFLALSNLFRQGTTFSKVDLAVAVVLQASLALSFAPGRRAVALVSGAAAGFAAGMKVTATPLVLIILLGYLARTWRASGPAMAARRAAAFVLSAILAGGYWYVRNWAVTGNPVFPAAFGPFAGPFLKSEQQASTLAHVLGAGLPWDQIRRLFVSLFNQPATLVALILAASVWQAFAWIRRRGFFRDGPSDATGMELMIVVASLVQFPFLPFSGLNEVGGLETTGRYILIGYVAAVLLTAPAVARLAPAPGRHWQRAAGCFGLSALVLVPTFFRLGAWIWAPMVLATGGGYLLLERANPAVQYGIQSLARCRRHWILALAAAVVGTGCFAAVTSRRIDQAVLRDPVLAALEKLPPGATVSSYGDRLFHAYSFFGRRLQFRPVRLLQDGRAAGPLHLRARHDPSLTFWEYLDRDADSLVNREAFLANLRRSGVDFLITRRNARSGWPVQHAWLREAGVPVVASLPDGTLWRLNARTGK